MGGNEGSIAFALLFLLAALLIAGILHGVAYYHHFLTTQDKPVTTGFKPKVAIIFVLVFLLLSRTLPSLLYGLLQTPGNILARLIGQETMLMASYTISSFLNIGLILFIAYIQDAKGLKEVIGFNKVTLLEDIKQGIYTFLLAIFVVTAAGILVQLLTYFIFHENGSEQHIITYLRANQNSILIKLLGFVNIVIIAPALEEIVFRGGIQKTLRRYFSAKKAIGFTSLIFALVHFSFEQGLGNIALLVSIFILSCYLGFVYEKRQTIVSPFIVHMLFNLDGVARIFLGSN